jgi:uncharacterized protein (TIGR03435 family)
MRFQLIRFGKVAIVAISVLGLTKEPRGFAQPALTQSMRQLEFDAASIRLDNDPANPQIRPVNDGPGTRDPGRKTYRQRPLYNLIQDAYDVAAYRLYGHLENTRNAFTMVATMPQNTTAEQFRAMLRNFLAERFHLTLHHETRNFPGDYLVVAPGGLRIKEWVSDPNAPAIGRGEPGQPGYAQSLTLHPSVVHVQIRQTMAEFANNLPSLTFMSDNMSGDSDRDSEITAGLRANDPSAVMLPSIIDKTGLSGIYEFNLDFEGYWIAGRGESAGGPTIYMALEKQVGLKLVKVKAVPTDVLVIDHVDKLPTEN